MTEILRESHAILNRVLGMTIPQRTNKSGHVHQQQSVTIPYLDTQAAEQTTYYREYHQYVPISF